MRFPPWGHALIFSPPGTDPPFPPLPPGKAGDGDVGTKAYSLFHAIDSHLSDVALALAFFKRAENEVSPIGNLASFPSKYDWHRAVSQRNSHVNQIARMHARSFVSSAEMTLKVLTQLGTVAKDYELAGVVEKAEAQIEAEIPHLRPIRDSIQHADERVQGLARSKPIVPEQLDTVHYKGPQIHVGILDGDIFRYTAKDGVQAEVTISDATLRSLTRWMQWVLDNAPWYRPQFGSTQLLRFKAVK